MSTRRQEKVAQVVKRAVSYAISQDLADPRITGLVSVTRVTVTADLRNAEVYLSVYTQKPNAEKRTFEAIEGARHVIQARVAAEVRSKFCPILRFHRDEQFKKTLDLMNLIDRAAGEYQTEDESDGLVGKSDSGAPAAPVDREDFREEL